MNIYQDKILILDFGSQYTQLIARRIRECGVYCELLPYNIGADKIIAFQPKGIILSGGPNSVNQEQSPSINEIVFTLNIPILGICYGMQALSRYFNGQVETSQQREFGYASVTIINPSPLLEKVPLDNHTLEVWMSHGDKVSVLPQRFKQIGKTNTCHYAMIEHEELPYFGVQFHPEVTHTTYGKNILSNFVLNICQCNAVWNSSNIIEMSLINIKNKVKEDKVVLGLSGGVDSSVTALLLHKAIGKQLTCIFVDNGLLRLNEAEQVMNMFSEQFGLNIIHVNAEQLFLERLAGEKDPEKKRKIIGKTFIDIFDEQASKLGGVKWLAQGTIYPDVIESAGKNNQTAHVIKSHHNVGGLPENMTLQLIEPLSELFKDEVREIGLQLGLPADMINRHPFPGPGLGVRVLGEVKKEYCDIVRYADAIFIEELFKYELYYKVSQAFVVFLPVLSVGVMGDGRVYDYVVSLRAVETVDFMTAKWAELPYDFLSIVSNRIINEVKGISRVVYDISGKPPSTIEWE